MLFHYRALNPDQEVVAGQIEAASVRAASRAVRQRGLNPLQVNVAERGRARRRASGRAPATAVRLTLHQLVTLLNSGVSLIEAVNSLARSAEHPAIAAPLETMARQLQRGDSMSAALLASGLRVPDYVHRLAQAGEMTGRLGPSLGSAVEQMAHDHATAQEFRNALIYPVILIVSGIAAVILIFTLVVPQFTDMLDRGENIPLLAQWVLGAGQFFNQYAWQIVGVAGVAVAAVAVALQRQQTRQMLWELAARLPLVGAWIREAEVARWSGLMGTLLENRVEMSAALQLGGDGLRTRHMGARFRQVGRRVRDGNALAEALAETNAIGPTGIDMVRVGERAGELASMLRSLSQLATDRGRERMKQLLAVIEPAAILVIGGIIGLIMAAVVLAITSVNEIPV